MAPGTAEKPEKPAKTEKPAEPTKKKGKAPPPDDDPALKEMGRKFSRRVGPPKAGIFFAWVQDGATAQERAALRESVPGPVLTILAGVFGRRYRKEIAPVWR